MLKKLLVAFLLFVFFIPYQVDAAPKRPYLAVFNNPGGQDDFLYEDVDLMFTGSNWNDFDKFIQLVKSQAKGRDIVIDISCHGSPTDGYLWLDYDAFGYNFQYMTSVGHVLNQIEENLPQCKKVWLEACYSELCMEKSLRVKKEFKTLDGNIVESYRHRDIDFPVYGIGPTPNYNNLVYLQDKHNIRAFFMDLRDTLNDGQEAKADDTKDDQLLMLFQVLCVLSR